MERTERHLDAERALAIVGGGATEPHESAHLLGCPACRTLRETLELGLLPGSPAAEARLRHALLAAPPLPPLRPRAGGPAPLWRALALGGALGFAVAAIALLAPRGVVDANVEEGVGALSPIWMAGRPTDARFELALPWSPLRLVRGAAGSGASVPVEALFSAWDREPAGHTSALVAAFVARGEEGDLQRAEEVLAGRPSDAATENDRGVLAHAAGRPSDALRHFDESARLRPAAPHTRFNRAVALEALGRRAEAAAAWRTYLELEDAAAEGWRVEAQRRLAAIPPD